MIDNSFLLGEKILGFNDIVYFHLFKGEKMREGRYTILKKSMVT